MTQGLKPDILVVNSDTKAEPNGALFLKTLMPTLAEYQPRIVLASRPLLVGLALNKTTLMMFICFLTGVLTPTDIMQMSARYRPAKRLFYWFEDKTTDQRTASGRNKTIRR